MKPECFAPVQISKAYRLFNLGGTSLVSAADGEDFDIMPATWNCPLDVDPFLMTVVIDKTHYTRRILDRTRYFAIQLPSVGIAKELLFLGSHSKNEMPDKVEKSGIDLFYVDNFDIPLAKGCLAWGIFEKLPEAAMARTYDLFFGKCVACFADTRVYRNNHWDFTGTDESLRTFHYVAGGHFFGLGKEYNEHEYDALG